MSSSSTGGLVPDEDPPVAAAPRINQEEAKEFMKQFEEKMDGKIPTLPYIPKEVHLTGTSNYRIWKERMISVLEGYDLNEFD